MDYMYKKKGVRIRESICSYESFGVSERGSECVDGWMDGWVVCVVSKEKSIACQSICRKNQ